MPNFVETIILEWYCINPYHSKGGIALEETYITMVHKRPEPDSQQAHPSGGKRPSKPPRHSIFRILYRLLVILSILIIAGYLAWNYLLAPPPGVAPPVSSDTSSTDMSSGSAPDNLKGGSIPRRDKVYNILLAATDNAGVRTDTMMVLNYDVPNQKVGVVSIPRDTLIDRGSGRIPKLVYGTGGVQQRVKDISKLLGVPIDYYIKVDLTGFIALVDYVGGVDFYVPCDMDYDDPYQDLSIHFKEGQYHLDGQQAMEVARFRKNNDKTGYTDVGRSQTQQNMLVALSKKVLSWHSLTKINGFVEIFNDYVDTDLELKHMLYFASQGIHVDPATDVETTTLVGDGTATFRGHKFCYALDPESTLDTVNRLINPYVRDLTPDEMNLPNAS